METPEFKSSGEVAGNKYSEIIAKEDDLGSARKAVEDAAAVSTGLWVSYLFMFFYVSVAAGAVTHLDLLLENPVRLPFLIIELPLLAFFLVAPLLFLIIHAYTLVHLVLLARKSVQFHERLYALFPSANTAEITEVEDRHNRQIRNDIRRQLPSNIFVQFLAGPSDVRNTTFGQLLRAIAWLTLVFGPIALLLELQIQFLPYHGLQLTWLHRCALILDLLLLWWLWERILIGYDRPRKWSVRSSWSKCLLGACSIVTIWFSCTLAITPGEWQEVVTVRPLYRFFFHGDIDPNTHRRLSLLSNTLVLPRFNVYDALKVDDPKKVVWREQLLSIRGRELNGAVFDGAFLERTDAQGAQLQGASFVGADLRGSALTGVNLSGASLNFARLQGAIFLRANLDGATLVGSSLQGANLTAARLQGADLSFAHLRGTSFRLAKLSGASLDGADLEGSSLSEATLQGTTFSETIVKTSSFDKALVWRAVFDKATLADIVGTPNWVSQDRAPNHAWGASAYTVLQTEIKAIPEPERRTAALERIKSLDCAFKGSEVMACDDHAQKPDRVALWQRQFIDAGIDRVRYSKALAAVYLDLVCSGNYDALLILRTLATMAASDPVKMLGILETGNETRALIETFLDEKKCNVVSQLTDADRFTLFSIRNGAPPALAAGSGSPN
jgi:uncharacterized protein YjbI with pentapeptide repeats